MAKKTIKLYIKLAEILYDVANKTYLANRTNMEGEKFIEAANAVVDNSEESENEILRSIQSTIGLLSTHLGKYINNSPLSLDNERKAYIIVFYVPNNFNNATNVFISSSIHDYIVNYCIGNWYLKTNKEEAASYHKMASGLLSQIYEAMSKRIRHHRGEDF